MPDRLNGRLTPEGTLGGSLSNRGTLRGILGGIGAAVTYASLPDKPSINNVELVGNKTTSDLHISFNDLEDKPTFPDVDEIEDRLDTLEGEEASLDSRLTSAEGDITSLDSRLTSAEGNISSLAGRVTTNEGAISDLQNDMTDVQGDISDVQGDISDLETGLRADEGNISSLTGRMTTAEGDISSLAGRMTTAEGNITSLDGRVTTAEGGISDLETGLGAAEGNITSLDGRVTTNEGNISDLQDDMTQAQSDITQLNSSKVSKVNTQLTLTRTANNYVDATSFARLAAVRKDNVLFFICNLALTASIPTSALSDFVEIGRISGWSSAYTIMQQIPSQQSDGNSLSIRVTSNGIVSIFATKAASSWYRTVVSIPASN